MKNVISNHKSSVIYLKSVLVIFFVVSLFSFIDCDNNLKCYKSQPFKDGPITVFEFTSLIDKVLISDDHLIVAGLNDIYLLDQYNNDCLSKNQFYNKSNKNLDPQNRNKILVELDKDLEKFLICNTMVNNGCSIFYHEHGQLRILDDNFNFNSNFNLKFCLISKLSHEQNFVIACEPEKMNSKRIVLAKLKFDENKNTFQMMPKVRDGKSMITLNGDELDNVKIELVYEFDQLMVDSKERFYHAYVLKREEVNGRLKTKLGRVCLSDNSFRSYSEIAINCKEKQDLSNWPVAEIYTYASTGQLGYAYSYLNKDTLYVTFNSYDGKHKSIDESKGSVLCAFDIEKIDRFFSESIRKCNSGGSTKKVKLMTQYQTTKTTKIGQCFNVSEKLDVGQLSCLKNPINPYIEFEEKSLSGEFLYQFKKEIIISSSAFLFRNQNSETRRGVVLSTKKGKIYRLLRDEGNNFMKIGDEFQFSNVSIKQIDSFVSKDSVFFITGHFLIKYPLNLSNQTSNGENIRRRKYRNTKNSRIWEQLLIISTVIIFIFSIYLVWKCFKSKKESPDDSIDIQEKVALKPRSNFARQASEILAKNNILIHESCLKTFEKVGSGFFACVYKGELRILGPSKKTIEVAIKTLNDLSTEDDEIRRASQSLIDEALLMKDLKHENILPVIGVCFQENQLPKIILPFMKQGSLLEYIRSDKNELTVRDLLHFAIDVGEGMAYLSSLKYVHRDLACRNCMLDSNLVVKISDFGLSRDCYEQCFYISKSKNSLPIKWMAPESLERSSTTPESDVWSYGVLLWELMTRGNIPYPTIESYRVLDYIKKNYRLQRPETCPQKIYEIMLDCWLINAFMRPSFNEIVLRIEAIIKGKEPEYDIYPDMSVNYVNYPVEDYYSEKNEKTNESSVDQPIYNRSLKKSDDARIEMPGQLKESEL